MTKTTKPKASRKPKLSVVVPFPEDKVVRYRDLEKLIRKLRRAKEELSDIMILANFTDRERETEFFVETNGISRRDALWLLEQVKLDVLGLTTPVQE